MLAGIRDILIISTPEDQAAYKRLLGNGRNFGINFEYKIQESPDGLAQAFILGEDFIGSSDVCLILGDNIFYGQGLSPKLHKAVGVANLEKKATVFGYQVNDPQRFGVVEFGEDNLAISIEEKPKKPKSSFAVTGLYFYPNSVTKIAKNVKPSNRNELEITSINNYYLENNSLNVEVLGRGFAWLDTGTHNSLIEASQFVQTVEHRQGYKIACLEEIAFNNKWIGKKEILDAIHFYGKCDYTNYIKKLIS